jgi:hypothetical protein
LIEIEQTVCFAKPIASTPAKMDQEVARQLTELSADERSGNDGTRNLTPACVEAAIWCVAALGAWLAARFFT